MKRKPEAVRAWGYRLRGKLAAFCEKHRPPANLLAAGQRMVRVRVIPESDYQRLRRAAGLAQEHPQ